MLTFTRNLLPLKHLMSVSIIPLPHQSVLGIRDILTRIRITRIPLANGSGFNSRSHPTPFFSDLRCKKNIYFFAVFFFITCLPTGTLSSVLKLIFLQKFCVKILFCNFASIVSVRSTHSWEKGRIRSRIRISDKWIRMAQNLRIRIPNTVCNNY